jgi:nucleoside-diphosphate-sugar epimerase
LCVPVIRPKTFIGTHRLGVFQILYDWVESGKRIPMIGNGKNRYQLLEVDDLAEAIYLGATVEAARELNV